MFGYKTAKFKAREHILREKNKSFNNKLLLLPQRHLPHHAKAPRLINFTKFGEIIFLHKILLGKTQHITNTVC